jgi:hypothetical protein
LTLLAAGGIKSIVTRTQIQLTDQLHQRLKEIEDQRWSLTEVIKWAAERFITQFT